MLHCLSLQSPSAATSTSQPNSPTATIDLHNHNASPPYHGTSTDGTPVSSSKQSPTDNLTREYTLAVQSNSYKEMWSKITVLSNNENGEQVEFRSNDEDDEDARQLLLTQVLQPNRECVEEALRNARPNNLTRLMSHYFEHSEKSTHHCLLLHRSVYRARALYDSVHKLLEVLSLDSQPLTQSQCDYAYEIFRQFASFSNPFPCPDSHNFQDIRQSLWQLRQHLDRRLRKSRSRVRLVRRATAASVLCIIGSVLAITVATVCCATHTIVALSACPISAVTNLPRKLTKKETANAKQLDAAKRGTFVLNSDLDTIDRLGAQLYTSVEDVKDLIRLALDSGCESYHISEVLKHLQKDHVKFVDQLKDLEERICLYFNAVNKARSLLLQEIHSYRTSN